MAATAILNLITLIPIFQFLPNFTKFGMNVETLKANTCMLSNAMSTDVWLPEFNMAAAAILNLEKLMLYLHSFTKFQQIW